jgi:glycosyltransferase involved in cell wall biosynthesis
MNRYVMLSSVMPPVVFQAWIDAGEVINPSHQLYFSRWIQSLSKHIPIQIISLPPTRTTKKNLWHAETIHRDNQQLYIQFSHPRHRFLKALWLTWSTHRYLRQLLKKNQDLVYVFIDGNSTLAGHIAKRYRRHNRIRTVGMFTDDPHQLTGVSKTKANQWIALHQHHHAYIGITEPLLRLFNPHQRPQLVIPGIVESSTGAKQHPRPYIFFSGALFSRYGIDALVKGFLQLKGSKFDLLVSGFGPEASMIEQLSQQHRHIKFLGLLTPSLVRKYQAGAYVNVNPRPVDKTLDSVAIPSKVFDYIASGAPTLTTRHPFFEHHFNQELQWIEDASEDGIRVALLKFLNLDYSLVQAKAIKAKTIAIEQFGLVSTGQRLFDWINSLK